ncbi:MAG: hypothetical protein AAGJ87_12365, partial [Pseudomonadota bacterium]
RPPGHWLRPIEFKLDKIGYRPTPSGLFEFEFYRAQPMTWRTRLTSAQPAIAVVIAFCLLAGAMDIRWNRTLTDLESLEQELLVQAKSTRRDLERFEFDATALTPLPQSADDFASALEQLPDSLIVERIDATETDLSIHGFAPKTEVFRTDAFVIQSRAQSPYQDVDRIIASIALDASSDVDR